MAVVDASVVASMVLPDEGSASSDDVVERLASMRRTVPPIFRYEMTNVIHTVVRRQRLGAGRAGHLLAEVSAMRLEVIARGQDPMTLLEVGLTHGITSYDAAYLSLAMATDQPLATLDGRLRAAAEAVGVALA